MRTLRKIIIVILVVCVVGLVSAASYAWIQMDVQARQLAQLHQTNSLLNSENVLLQKQYHDETQQRDARIIRLEKTLQGLKDVEVMKAQLESAQERLGTLDTEYGAMSREKTALEQANLNLNTRVSNLTRELTRTLDDLRTAKRQLSQTQGDTAASRYARELEQYKEMVKDKETKISALTGQLKELQTQNTEGTRTLKERIAQLEKEKKQMEKQLARAQKAYDKHARPVAKLKERVRELEQLAAMKEKERLSLERDLKRGEAERKELERKFTHAQELLAELQRQALQDLGTNRKRAQEFDSLKTEKVSLTMELKKAQLRIDAQTREMESLRRELAGVQEDVGGRLSEKQRLKDELAQLRREKEQWEAYLGGGSAGDGVPKTGPAAHAAALQEELNKAYALYDTAKAQVVKFSELVMDREMELERMKQRVTILEQELRGEDSQGTSRNVMQQRIAILNETVLDKERRLQEKETQIAELQRLELERKDQLQLKIREYEEVNSLCGSLRSQVMQVTEILAQKETSLMDRNRQTMILRSDFSRLQADLEAKKTELDQIRQRQALTLEELARATKLNVTLQENLVQMYKGGGEPHPEDKKRADELRQEVEKLLGK